MKNILKVASRIQGAGIIQIPNHVQGNSGAYGVSVGGVANVTNLTAGATVTIVVGGREVLSANDNGTHTFNFGTGAGGQQETIHIDVAVSNSGACDLDVTLRA